MAITLRARVLVLLLAALVGITSTEAPASAARPGPLLTVPHVSVRLAGQVTAVIGRASTPTGFSLQLPNHTVDIQIVPRTTFLARSAEAQIEGFGQYVFALVTATKVNGMWTASRVDYDVVPFGPIRDFTASGKVTWIDRKARTFRFRMNSGDIHLIRVVQRTKFQVDGQPVDVAPPLGIGSLVDVTVHRNLPDQWIALSVNLRLGSPGHYGYRVITSARL